MYHHTLPQAWHVELGQTMLLKGRHWKRVSGVLLNDSCPRFPLPSANTTPLLVFIAESQSDCEIISTWSPLFLLSPRKLCFMFNIKTSRIFSEGSLCRWQQGSTQSGRRRNLCRRRGVVKSYEQLGIAEKGKGSLKKTVSVFPMWTSGAGSPRERS